MVLNIIEKKIIRVPKPPLQKQQIIQLHKQHPVDFDDVYVK